MSEIYEQLGLYLKFKTISKIPPEIMFLLQRENNTYIKPMVWGVMLYELW